MGEFSLRVTTLFQILHLDKVSCFVKLIECFIIIFSLTISGTTKTQLMYSKYCCFSMLYAAVGCICFCVCLLFCSNVWILLDVVHVACWNMIKRGTDRNVRIL